MWFKTLRDGSIDLWKDIYGSFNMAILSRVTQRKKKTLYEYIDYFTKMVVVKRRHEQWFKCWLFEKGLRLLCMLREKLWLEGLCNLGDFLNKAQYHMN